MSSERRCYLACGAELIAAPVPKGPLVFESKRPAAGRAFDNRCPPPTLLIFGSFTERERESGETLTLLIDFLFYFIERHRIVNNVRIWFASCRRVVASE